MRTGLSVWESARDQISAAGFRFPLVLRPHCCGTLAWWYTNDDKQNNLQPAAVAERRPSWALSTYIRPSLPPPTKNPLRNNVRRNHRYRSGHHLLVSRSPTEIPFQDVLILSHIVVLVSTEIIVLRSFPMPRVRRKRPPVFLSRTPGVSSATPRRTRQR